MPAPQLRGKKILSPRSHARCAGVMRLRDPMRRLTIYAASLATIGFVGGVLMGTPRSTHDHVLQDSVRADEANADPERTFSPIPRPQPKPVGGSAEKFGRNRSATVNLLESPDSVRRSASPGRTSPTAPCVGPLSCIGRATCSVATGSEPS